MGGPPWGAFMGNALSLRETRDDRAHRGPPAPRLTISGSAFSGGSKRGGTLSSGATRSMTLPVVGAAFQPEVMKPCVPSTACGSSRIVRKTYFGLSMGYTAVKVLRFLVLE